VTCCRSFTEPLTMISTQPIETTIHNSRFQPFAYHHSNRSTRRRQHSKRIPRNEPNQGNDGLVLMIVRVSKRSLAIAANTKWDRRYFLLPVLWHHYTDDRSQHVQEKLSHVEWWFIRFNRLPVQTCRTRQIPVSHLSHTMYLCSRRELNHAIRYF
jgi:hypothetical protein